MTAGRNEHGGRDRRRSGDPALFRRVLCQLSYPTMSSANTDSAVPTGLEPATSGLTGRRELQLHHGTRFENETDLRTPNGIRTRAATLKGWCPRPLDDGGKLLLARWKSPTNLPADPDDPLEEPSQIGVQVELGIGGVVFVDRGLVLLYVEQGAKHQS